MFCFLGNQNCFVFVVWKFRLTWEYFPHLETSPLPLKGFKFWPIVSTHGHWTVRDLFTCHTYCDMSQPIVMAISEDPWQLHLLLSAKQWTCLYLLWRLRFVPTGDRTPISHMECQRSKMFGTLMLFREKVQWSDGRGAVLPSIFHYWPYIEILKGSNVMRSIQWRCVILVEHNAKIFIINLSIFE